MSRTGLILAAWILAMSPSTTTPHVIALAPIGEAPAAEVEALVPILH